MVNKGFSIWAICLFIVALRPLTADLFIVRPYFGTNKRKKLSFVSQVLIGSGPSKAILYGSIVNQLIRHEDAPESPARKNTRD
jgi:hypothetical protein